MMDSLEDMLITVKEEPSQERDYGEILITKMPHNYQHQPPKQTFSSPPKISNPQLNGICLFCPNIAPNEMKKLHRKNAPAGGECEIFEKQLQIFFIVHKLLDVPFSWSEKILENGDDKPPIQYWLRVCTTCILEIETAWKLHQQLLSIQYKINVIKDKLRNDIKSNGKMREFNENGRTDLMNEIREFIVSGSEVIPCPKANVRRMKIHNENEEIQEDFENFDEPAGGIEDYREDPENLDHENVNIEMKMTDDLREAKTEVTEEKEAERPKRQRKRKINSFGKTRKRIRIRKRKAVPSLKSKPLYPLHCGKCPARYETGQEDKLKEHMKAHDRCNSYGGNGFMCRACKFPSETKAEFEAHWKVSHPRLRERKCPYSSSGCKFTTFVEWNYQKHLEAKHPEIPKPQSTEDLTCPICQKKTGSKIAFTRHKRSDHPEIYGKKLEKEIECDRCGQKFDNAILLEQHKKFHEKQEIPNSFFCEVCGKGFKKIGPLRIHMKHHEEKGQWICALCGADYKLEQYLLRHQHIHHPETLDPARVNPKFVRKRDADIVECRICHIKLPVALRLRHMKIHDDDKPYKCDECDRSYFDKHGLKKHKEVNHSKGATNVNCPHCSKEFIHPNYLKSHFKHCRMKKLQGNSSDQGDA